MFTRAKRVICGIFAAAVMAAASVTAYADHTYQLSGDGLCDEIKAASKEINGAEGTFETTFGDSTEEKYISLRFKLFNEYLDAEFWNNDDVMVSVDVKLETEGADVIGCIPGFGDNWSWVNPSDYIKLKYGEWITISETGKHFYTEFAKTSPSYLLFQVRTNWGAAAQGDVKVSIRNFRITGGSAEQPIATTAPESTTTAETTTSATTTAVSEEPAESSEITAEGSNEPETVQAADTTSGAPDPGPDPSPEVTSAATESAPAVTHAATSISTNATKSTSSEIKYNELYEHESPIKMIIIIVGVAVFVSVGSVIGYIIYKKKKFY